MRHWHIFAIDRISLALRHRLGREVRDDLMPVQIEVDPMLGTATLGAAQQISIESAGGRDIVDGESEVKRWDGHYKCTCSGQCRLSRLSLTFGNG